ncbi:MAG: phage holin family protein [Pseudomonadota bacterium]
MTDQTQNPIDDAPLRALISDIVTRITTLLRKEFDLARSEVSENLNRAAFGAGLMVVAVVLALTALNVLAVAAVAALMSTGLDVIWATLAIGGGGLILAIILAGIGISRVKPANLKPKRSIRELQRSTEAAKEAVNA